ncbi:putative methionyl-tRNA synthetase [Hordeum vulgare]|nr:putative methionyl-tRNA synthetase [Hordeum vulgare]
MPSPMFSVGLITKYSYSLPKYPRSPTPTLCRGAIPFAYGSAPQSSNTNIDMDEIITNNLVAAVPPPDGSDVRHVLPGQQRPRIQVPSLFTRIESCEKWTDCRLALAKAKDDIYNLAAPASATPEGRPDGTKRAKTARDAAPATERLQSSIEQCIADAKSNAAKREEKSEARWSALMTKQDAKLDLLRTNVVVKKRNTNLAFLMGADVSIVDEQVKVWYLAEHGLILNKMSGPAATIATHNADAEH